MSSTRKPKTTNQQRVEAWHKEWLESDGASETRKWGDRINWVTAEAIAHRLDQEIALEA